MAMNSEKMTYVKALNTVLTTCELADDVREKLEALRDAQMKRNNSEKKPTKVQQENESLKAHLLETLATLDKAVTVSELMEADEVFGAMSNQKVASLVRALVNDGKVERTEEKRKAYFSLVK